MAEGADQGSQGCVLGSLPTATRTPQAVSVPPSLCPGLKNVFSFSWRQTAVGGP